MTGVNTSDPERLGHYRILGRVGQGGMGTVYRAEDTKLRRIVALKRVTPQAVEDDNARRRLLREARAVSALDHPNIVAVFAVEEEDGVDFIVMEYVDGESLDVPIARGPLDLSRALTLAAEVADALYCAHGAGIVHRDVKPSNIMVTKGGRAKVLDFGVAKLTESAGLTGVDDATSIARLTASGALVGTMPYMSPEQLRGGPIDGRTDVFALGCVVYEAATGRRAFPATDVVGLVREITSRDPIPPSEILTTLPAGFDALVS